jgi:hypothetical protein
VREVRLVNKITRYLPGLIALLTITGAGCWWSTEYDLPPQPVMLAHPDDQSLSEDGIDAVPEDNRIQEQWLGLRDRSVAGYRLYRFVYSDDQRVKIALDSLVADIPQAVPVAETVTWFDRYALMDMRYYYYAQSYDKNDSLSERSGTADYKLVGKVPPTKLETPRGNWYTSRPEFKFSDLSSDVSIRAIVLKVFDVNAQTVIWASDLIEPFNASVIRYNVNGTADVDTLTYDHRYRWRLDVVGRDANSGSESQWIDFTVLQN